MKKKSLSRILKIVLPLSVAVGFSVIHLDSIIKIIENINITLFRYESKVTIVHGSGETEQKPKIAGERPPLNVYVEQAEKTVTVSTEITKKEDKNETPSLPEKKDYSEIDNNQEYSDSLIKRTDINIHKFTLDSPCCVSIIFKTQNNDDASYKLVVRDSFGRTLASELIYAENIITRLGRLYLREGTYTLEIQRGNLWSGKIYKFSVNTFTEAEAHCEAEYNDSIELANSIALNQDIHASSGSANDVDYFTFTLNNLSSVRPELRFSPIDSKLDASRLRLYTLTIAGADSGKEKRFTFRGDSTPSRTIEPFTLRAGSYIVSVSREKRSEVDVGIHEYNLRINVQ